MKKSEILEVLYTMHEKWQDAYTSKNPSHMQHIEVHAGFCFYITFVNNTSKTDILLELAKDRITPTLNLAKGAMWYETFDFRQNKQALLFRLENLNRTIERLETEVASDIQVN